MTQEISDKEDVKYKEKANCTPVAYFIIEEANRIKLQNDYSCQDDVHLKCKTLFNGEFSVTIPMDDFRDKNIKRQIEKSVEFAAFSSNLSVGKINALLYNHILELMDDNITQLNHKPGFYKTEQGEWYFSSHDENAEHESEKVQNSVFTKNKYEDDRAFEIVSQYCELVKKHRTEKLAVLRMAGLLLTPLKSLGYELKKLIVFCGCEHNEQKQMLCDWIQVYNRETVDYDMTIRFTGARKCNIEKEAYDSKDCILLIDDNTAENTKKPFTRCEHEKVQLLADLFSFARTKPKSFVECIGAVISDRLMHEKILSEEAFLFCDLRQLGDMKRHSSDVYYKFDQIVVNHICILFEQRKKNVEAFRESKEKSFRFTSSENAYQMLCACVNVFRDLCQYYQVKTMTEDDWMQWKEDLYLMIHDSENFHNPDVHYEKFRSRLHECICEEKVKLIDSDAMNENLSKAEPVIYVKDNLLLLKSDVFKTMISTDPMLAMDAEGTELRKILRKKGMLLCNSGEENSRYLYRTSLGGEGREYFIALNCDILDDEVKQMLPRKESAAYHAVQACDGVERIRLGETEGGQPVYWSIGADLMNRHLFVRGKSGAGKTYLLTALAKKLHDAGKRVIIMDCAKVRGYDFTELHKVVSLEYIMHNITVSKKFDPVSKVLPTLERILIMRGDSEQTEHFLQELMQYCEANKKKGIDTYLILDEVADMDISTSTALGKILLQGRKINLNVIAATQILSGKGVKSKQEILGQCSLQIALPVDRSMQRKIAKEIDSVKPEQCCKLLASLQQGEAVVFGELETEPGTVEPQRYIKAKITLQ